MERGAFIREVVRDSPQDPVTPVNELEATQYIS